MQLKTAFIWILRILSAAILLQTLYFKFTGHPESVALFSKLGVEPWGRVGTGIIELIAGILLLLPATFLIGALLGVGLMAGAILSHIMVIGIESSGDGGQLFLLAIIVLCSCVLILILKRAELLLLLKKITVNK